MSIGLIYVFYVGHIGKITLFHVVILSKHHHHHHKDIWSADFVIDKESKQGYADQDVTDVEVMRTRSRIGVPHFDDCTLLAQKTDDELIKLTQYEEVYLYTYLYMYIHIHRDNSFESVTF
jgi:hypothetical protein